MRYWITLTLFVIFWGATIFLSLKYGKKDPKPNNYETKYDSLQQQLQLERTVRIDLSHISDSLYVLVDSLTNVSKSIQVEIREVPGKYNTFNSEELTNKMIEAYEQR
jgi:hypothetical protein